MGEERKPAEASRVGFLSRSHWSPHLQPEVCARRAPQATLFAFCRALKPIIIRHSAGRSQGHRPLLLRGGRFHSIGLVLFHPRPLTLSHSRPLPLSLTLSSILPSNPRQEPGATIPIPIRLDP
ncbi:hypothetical protein ASPBRDRAFT_257043 [Aspergillus brasiliensis CBS 101740]|uniref:Uncharacterized protein n=1 Tax=Aspergillus brasiliensis (strain CBS 101740 / IMI 381727 / IBT 21946) TaxID=767769 RepID=A0A1L9V2H7_ASPBC|nr:hypothetical protein ASPBRDRAFT_257043 [Aspergillus brasiliensis CBS 101740]